jgi:NADPH:quinone reductase
MNDAWTYIVTMRAVVLHGESLEIEERDDLVAGHGDVVVDVASAGINAADLLQRRGFYPAPAGWPTDIPGMEFAGTVRSLGSGVTTVSVGQRVCAIVGGGAQADQCVVPAEHVLPVPDHVDLASAGGFPEAFTTAYDALTHDGIPARGLRVLVSGAAGGVGTAVVQLARAWGAHVIAATRDEQFHHELLTLGASEVTTTDRVDSLDPVQYVIELVGAAHLDRAQKILAPYARVVVIGVSGGGRIELDLLALMSRRTTWTGSTLRSRSRAEKADIAQRMCDDVVPLWESKTIVVPISRSFEIENATAAYDTFSKTGKLGKIVLTTD